VIDTVAYTAAHGGQLLQVQGSVGAFVVISSASVYRDATGRTLDESRATGFLNSRSRSLKPTQPSIRDRPPTRRRKSRSSVSCSTMPRTLLQCCGPVRSTDLDPSIRASGGSSSGCSTGGQLFP
jgi:hypothetical protein